MHALSPRLASQATPSRNQYHLVNNFSPSVSRREPPPSSEGGKKWLPLTRELSAKLTEGETPLTAIKSLQKLPSVEKLPLFAVIPEGLTGKPR